MPQLKERDLMFDPIRQEAPVYFPAFFELTQAEKEDLVRVSGCVRRWKKCLVPSLKHTMSQEERETVDNLVEKGCARWAWMSLRDGRAEMPVCTDLGKRVLKLHLGESSGVSARSAS